MLAAHPPVTTDEPWYNWMVGLTEEFVFYDIYEIWRKRSLGMMYMHAIWMAVTILMILNPWLGLYGIGVVSPFWTIMTWLFIHCGRMPYTESCM